MQSLILSLSTNRFQNICTYATHTDTVVVLQSYPTYSIRDYLHVRLLVSFVVRATLLAMIVVVDIRLHSILVDIVVIDDRIRDLVDIDFVVDCRQVDTQ